MKCFVIISLFLSLPLLLSCQSNSGYNANANFPIHSFYLDQHFPKPALFNIETEQEIFMLDDEMLAMVENSLNKIINPKKKALKLL